MLPCRAYCSGYLLLSERILNLKKTIQQYLLINSVNSVYYSQLTVIDSELLYLQQCGKLGRVRTIRANTCQQINIR